VSPTHHPSPVDGLSAQIMEKDFLVEEASVWRTLPAGIDHVKPEVSIGVIDPDVEEGL
jgi:hypothetical protein